MKVTLSADERGGCVATLTGCGIGGHTARVLFLDPDYGPVETKFDGDEVTFDRPVSHASCLASLVDSVTDWDVPAELEEYEAPKPKKSKKAEAKSEGED